MKEGPISNNDWFSNPLSIFFFKKKIKFGYKELLKTFKSELIGLTIFISGKFSLKLLFIFSSVNDHVIASKYPFEATDLWAKWKCLWKKSKVGFNLFLSGSTDWILSNPLILIISSTISIWPYISGLQLGISKIRSLPFFLILNPKPSKILDQILLF